MKRCNVRRAIVYRYLPFGAIVTVTNGTGRVRAFVSSGHGNYLLPNVGPEGARYLEIPIGEALDVIAASGLYNHDTRHPVVSQYCAMGVQS